MIRLTPHWLLCVLLLITLMNCNAYKILVISTMTGTSHTILAHGLIKHITKGGHEVTYVTSQPTNKPWPNVTEVDVGEEIRTFMSDIVNVQKIMEKEHDVLDMGMVFGFANQLFVLTLEHENTQKLMKDPNQKFDLIIAEWLFSDIYAGLPAIFDCPFVWLSTVEPHWMMLKMIDGMPNPAYNADIMSPNVPPFTFVQRVQELIFQIHGLIYQYFSFHPKESIDYERLIAPIARSRGKTVPSFDKLRHNVSLVLGNSHVSLGQATRLPQNYKPIAGYHIDANVKRLPQDLQKIMDDAKNGVIYFSLGSNLKSKQLPAAIKISLLKMFGELKQSVIWKFEEDLPNRPKNVHIVQWALQHSILAHPNCALFITHGGYLSSTETVHFGVPVIGVPVYGDQFNNIDRAVSKGYALRVDLSYTMAEDLKAAITEILTVPKYRERVKELSFVYHDRPVSPGDEVLHWVEHVVQTRGAPHLRSPALFLPWHQKMYLDLAALLLASLVAFKFLINRLLTTIRKGKPKSEKKNK